MEPSTKISNFSPTTIDDAAEKEMILLLTEIGVRNYQLPFKTVKEKIEESFSNARIALENEAQARSNADSSLQTQIEALQGAIIYLGHVNYTTAQITANTALLTQWCQANGFYPLARGYCLIDSGANDWWWNDIANSWINIGYYEVATATNNSKGVVQGNDVNLGVVVDDGKMSVKGLESALNAKQNALNRTVSLTGKATGSATDNGGALTIATAVSLAESDIPNLSADKITSGTLGADRIPALDASKITSGTLGADRIPALDASKITSGTLPDARIASAATWNAKQNALNRTVSLTGKATGSATDNGGALTIATAVSLAESDIPNLSADKITSGTLPIARGGTGATEGDAALRNLGFQIGKSTSAALSVGNNTNWNSLKKTGVYYVSVENQAANMNSPIPDGTSHWGTLMVMCHKNEIGNNSYPIAQVYYRDDRNIYYRSIFNSSSWVSPAGTAGGAAASGANGQWMLLSGNAWISVDTSGLLNTQASIVSGGELSLKVNPGIKMASLSMNRVKNGASFISANSKLIDIPSAYAPLQRIEHVGFAYDGTNYIPFIFTNASGSSGIYGLSGIPANYEFFASLQWIYA